MAGGSVLIQTPPMMTDHALLVRHTPIIALPHRKPLSITTVATDPLIGTTVKTDISPVVDGIAGHALDLLTHLAIHLQMGPQSVMLRGIYLTLPLQ
jgi:hypothetical protein